MSPQFAAELATVTAQCARVVTVIECELFLAAPKGSAIEATARRELHAASLRQAMAESVAKRFSNERNALLTCG